MEIRRAPPPRKIVGGVNSAVSYLAGIGDADKIMAGISTEAHQQQQADAGTTAAANATDQTGDQVDARVKKLKEGLGNQEQNAIQGMTDAATWIDVLDAYDQAPGHQQDQGQAYIDRTSKPLAAEWAGHMGGDQQKIDPAPLVAAAKRTRAEAASAPSAVTALGNQAVDDLPTRPAASLPGVDVSSATARGHVLVDEVVNKYRDTWTEMGREADEISTQAAGLKDSDLARYGQMSDRLDTIYKCVIAAQFRAIGDAALQALCDAIVGPADKDKSSAGPDHAPPPPVKP